MSFFKFTKKNREHDIQMKVNSLLKSLMDDTDQFTHQEQSFIVKTMFDRFKEIKSKERQNALNLANEITESLKQLR